MNRPKGWIKEECHDSPFSPHQGSSYYDISGVVITEPDSFEQGADALLASASQVVENQRDGERFEAITIPAKSRVWVIVTPMEEGK